MPATNNSTFPTSSSSPGETPSSIDPNQIKSDAGAAIEEARNVAGKVAEEATSQLGEIVDRAKVEAKDATDKAKGVANDQKDVLAAQIGEVAEAISRAADGLDGTSGRYTRMIADGALKLSDTIKSNDTDQILNLAQDYGRKQPAAFLGAAALLGFAASRFLSASAQRAEGAAVGGSRPTNGTQSQYDPNTGYSPGGVK